jgi:mono/diheme cytochrome c family protein
MPKLSTFVFLGIAATLFSGSANADSAGMEEYMNACATCHGVEADGNGPLSELMSVSVPALTGLSAANDGVFPMLDVIHSIDGRQGTRGHYPMPVWGQAFELQADADDLGKTGSEIAIRGRILSIAYYLESIQR